MAAHGTRAHKRARAMHVAAYRPGVTRCAIGHEVLTGPARLLDLAHSDDGKHYLGLACREHNRGPAAGRPGGNPYGGRSYGRKGSKIRRVAGQRSRDDHDRDHEREHLDRLAAREAERQRRLNRRVILPRGGR